MALGLPVAALAQTASDYPNKPIKLVVTFAPGGVTDQLARVVANKMSATLGQPITVENRTGANGNIGGDFVARSAPDGYTLLFGASGPIAMNPTLMRQMPFDPVKDFAHIGLIGTAASVLVVGMQFPAHNLRDLIKLLRANPGKFNFGSSGSGAVAHMSGELFKMMAGVEITHVPYRGDLPAINDVISGQVEMAFPAVGSAAQLIKAGRVRPIAYGGSSRSSVLPDVPTMNEAGLPGYDLSGWFSFLAPAGTPPEVVRRLNQELNRAVTSSDVRQQMLQISVDAVPPMTAEQFRGFHESQITKYAAIIRAAKLEGSVN